MSRRDSPPSLYSLLPLPEGRELVIKVKYSGTLKRLNASVNGSHFDHSLAALRSKIANAFKFSPDAEFTLTYTDEDGDVVMLDDDDDLRDAAISQKLNPLRIDVQLKSSSAGATHTKPQVSNSKSSVSAALEDQLAQVKSTIDEALKFVPELVPVVLSKLSHELRSKAASSAPSLAELLDRFAKLMAFNSSMQPSSGTTDFSSCRSSSGPQTLSNSKMNLDSGLKAVSASQSDMQTPKSSKALGLKSLLVENTKAPIGQASGHPSVEDPLFGKLIPRKKRTDTSKWNRVKYPSSSSPPTDGSVQRLWGYASSGHNGRMHGNLDPLTPPPHFPIRRLGPPLWPRIPADGKVNGNMPSSVSPYGRYQEGGYSYGGRSYRDLGNRYGSMSQHTLNRWIQCDGCGVTPIAGPRYKSNIKDDYDLCSDCFCRLGNAAEYTRIDKPTCESSTELDKKQRLHPDCRFIMDVTIPDGTVMAPSTTFTKIWRLCNSGSTMWPLGTQLIWVGGDKLAGPSSVTLGTTVNGFPVGEEIDVGVDLVAPVKPGRYISYWRIAAPYLGKFGQQVWVVIKVEQRQAVQTSVDKQTPELNLNLSPGGNFAWKPFIDMNAEPTDLVYEHPDFTEPRASLEPVRSVVPSGTTVGEPVQLPIIGSQTSSAGIVPMPAGVVEPVQVPIAEPQISSAGAVAVPAGVLTSEAMPMPKPISIPANVHAPVSVPVAPSPDEIVNHMEEKLLMELEQMGFRQADLNKEILRQNEYDLEKSVDDLCGFHEWDPLLAELNELGFDDTEVKEVPAKDGGESIFKRVAMNLLSRQEEQRLRVPSC